jgi:hypothetical protein
MFVACFCTARSVITRRSGIQLPHWYLIRADGSGLRSLTYVYGAGDPIDSLR